ncbi:hypothetical protein QYF36_025586 [Acer negundo]|nr:hypothetical protein QYF36_025586 [Acer negundo]
MVSDIETKNDDVSADSPTSVLEDEDVCKAKVGVNLEDEVTDDTFLISKAMKEEEEKLLEARVTEEDVEPVNEARLDDTQFKKLDELLTQTKLYTEFLMEKMEDITFVYPESPS